MTHDHSTSGRSNVWYGSSLVVLSSVFYGSYGVWTRLMGNAFGPYAQAWMRSLVVLLMLIPIACFGKQKWQPIRWRMDAKWLALWLFAALLGPGPLYYAVNRIGIGLAILISYCGIMLMMFVGGWLLNGERFTFDKLLATVLAVIGLLLTFSPSFGIASILPLLIALVSGMGAGLTVSVSQHVKYNSSQTAVMVWSAGVLANLPIALALHQHMPRLGADKNWLYMLGFAVMSLAASWAVIHGVKLIEAGIAGILGLLEIVWGLLFGVLFFHERPGLLVYLGAMCIIGAALIPYITEFKTADVVEDRLT